MPAPYDSCDPYLLFVVDNKVVTLYDMANCSVRYDRTILFFRFYAFQYEMK